jgi:inosose dehydratase
LDPEAETHVEYEDQIEAFLEQTDPARVSLCLDTGQHAYRGGDHVRFMRQHHDRTPYLRLKSVDAEVRRKVEAENFDGWATVEQDLYSAPFDQPLPTARRTRAYLREIGIG